MLLLQTLSSQANGTGLLCGQTCFTILVYAALVSGILYILIACVSLKQRRKRAAFTFSLLMFSAGIYSIGYFFELHSKSVAEVFLWLRIEYIGIVFIPALLTLFVLQYTDHEKWLRPPFAIGLFTIPVVTLAVVWTNQWHHLFYQQIEIIHLFNYTVPILGKGPWYWVNSVYYHIFLAVACFNMLSAVRHGNPHYRRRYILLLVGVLIPWIGMSLYQAGSGPQSLDLGPFSLIIAGLICLYYLFLIKPFDLIPVTRRNFFDHTQDGYLFLDSQDRIVDMNQAVKKLLAIDNTAVGRPVREIVSAATLPDASLAAELDGLEGIYKLKDGKRWVEVRASAIIDQKERFRATLLHLYDITARHRYEQELKHRGFHDALTGVYNRGYFEEELKRLSGGREYPITIITADLVGLKLVNDIMGHTEGDRLLRACVEVFKASLRYSDVLARIGGDEFALILTRTDAEAAEKVIERIQQNTERYNREQSSFPLSISLGMARTNDPGASLQDLYKKADELMYREKLSHSPKSSIVQALLDTLKERGLAPEGQARRLESLCRLFGQKAGLTSRQLNQLMQLSQMHDLGKVGIPDHILFKNGPLTAEEREIMQLHPEKGYRIASAAPHLSAVAGLILKHHERWDGTGYPLGLKGEEIPLECRIMAIVEAYNAIVSERPYRKTRNREEALAELNLHAGTQFDPALLALFLTVL